MFQFSEITEFAQRDFASRSLQRVKDRKVALRGRTVNEEKKAYAYVNPMTFVIFCGRTRALMGYRGEGAKRKDIH